jgi:hypothetical protein
VNSLNLSVVNAFLLISVRGERCEIQRKLPQQIASVSVKNFA